MSEGGFTKGIQNKEDVSGQSASRQKKYLQKCIIAINMLFSYSMTHSLSNIRH